VTVRELLVGTTNPARLAQLVSILRPAGILIRSAADLAPQPLPPVREDSQRARDNARQKAKTYAAQLGRPVFAVDAALQLDGIPPSEQPGVYVRRLTGRSDRPSDEEVFAHYRDLCRRHGGRLTGTWQFALAIATHDGHCHHRVVTSQRVLHADGSPRRRAGYPLDSLQLDPLTGRYLADMSSDEVLAYWQRTVGGDIIRFVTDTLALLDTDQATAHARAGAPELSSSG
jgi:inosine/xanthosine triphosphate pyrophosphatase family protein